MTNGPMETNGNGWKSGSDRSRGIGTVDECDGESWASTTDGVVNGREVMALLMLNSPLLEITFSAIWLRIRRGLDANTINVVSGFLVS